MIVVLAGFALLAYAIKVLKDKWILRCRGALVSNILKPTEIIIVNDEVSCNRAIYQLRLKIQKYSVIGLDCEWVSNPHKRPVALLQLATSGGFCLLIRLSRFSHMPWDLKRLLDDRSVIKVGSAITSDAKYLWNDYNLYVSGCVNIDRAAESVGVPGGSLKRMAEDVLNFTMNKHWSIQCSNWEADVLHDIQVNYAAMDALVPLKILEKIIRTKMHKVNLREQEAEQYFHRLWRNLITDYPPQW